MTNIKKIQVYNIKKQFGFMGITEVSLKTTFAFEKEFLVLLTLQWRPLDYILFLSSIKIETQENSYY